MKKIKAKIIKFGENQYAVKLRPFGKYISRGVCGGDWYTWYGSLNMQYVRTYCTVSSIEQAEEVYKAYCEFKSESFMPNGKKVRKLP
jgi:hypothetical protein